MAKITIILDKRRPDNNGRYPIRLRVVIGSTNTTIATNIYVQEKYFVGNPEQAILRTHANAKQANSDIKELYFSYLNAINELEKKGTIKSYSATDIRKYVESKKEYHAVRTFSSTIEEYKQKCRKHSTYRTYEYTQKLLYEFTHNDNIFFEDVNYKFLTDFDRWMEQRGMSGGSRHIVLHDVKAVFNYSINNEWISLSLYPFRRFKLQKKVGEKHYLDEAIMQRLMHLDVSKERKHQSLSMTRDLFLLSFYLCGANPIDLFSMQPAQQGKVAFVRTKISFHEPDKIRISIQPEAHKIIERYKGTTHMLHFAEKYVDYHSFYSSVCKTMKDLGKLVGCTDLTLYWARYSWATYASKIDIADSVISKALGHTDSTMAERHYISFDWTKVDKANRAVIDYVQSFQ